MIERGTGRIVSVLDRLRGQIPVGRLGVALEPRRFVMRILSVGGRLRRTRRQTADIQP
jgi:hypothetical protein